MPDILVASAATGALVRPHGDAAGAQATARGTARPTGFAAGRPGEAGAPAQAPPAATVHTAGAHLEALLWRPAATSAEGEPVFLRGPVIVAPAPFPREGLPAPGTVPGDAGTAFAGSAVVGGGRTATGRAASPSSGGPVAGGSPAVETIFATVVGPVGPDALLAEADGVFILLRGATLHLPTGAGVIVAWRGRPQPHPGTLLRGATGAGGSRAALGPTGSGLAAPRAVPEVATTAHAEGDARLGLFAPLAAEVAAADPTSVEAARRWAAESAPLAAPAQTGGDAGTTFSSPAELVERLARRLGLPVVDTDERDGRRGETIERGTAAVTFDFPALGRVRLECAWSAQGIEVRVVGVPALGDRDRAELLAAFAAGLGVAGVRGRVVLVERSDS